jgi:hypothetical protein
MPDTSVRILETQFKACRQSSGKEFAMLHDDIGSIKGDIRKIKENHLQHIQEEMTDIRIEVKKLAINQKWMMLIGGAIGGAIPTVIDRLVT